MPVGRINNIQERFPFFVSEALQCERTVWGPFRFPGLQNELHSGLLGGAPGLFSVALMTAAHYVLPGGLASPRSGNHMIDIQIVPREVMPTVLAGIFIPREDIETVETDYGPWDPIISSESDHPWDFDYLVYNTNSVVSVFGPKLAPALEIEGSILPVHSPGSSQVEEDESPPDRGRINGKKGSVKNKNACI